MRKGKAVVFEAKNKIAVREITLRPMEKNQMLTETLYTFVSPGTELRVLHGFYGAEGRYPVVPGYSVVARITEVGAEVRGFRVGDLVSCRNPVPFADVDSMWGGQASLHAYVAEGEDRPVLLPENCDPFDYVIAEVSSISLRGVESAIPRPGEKALVVGQGLIGAFSAEFLKMYGCAVTVCDIDDRRLAEARERGVSAVVDLKDPDAENRLKTIGNGGFDIVVESSGSTPGFQTSSRMIRRSSLNPSPDCREPVRFSREDWPRLVLQANYVADVSLNPFSFFEGEGVIVLTPFDRSVEDRQKVVELLRSGRVSGAAYTRNCFTPEEMPEVYGKLDCKEILSAVCRWK